MAPRASITDVARLAGVSVGTVSHVLNHPDRVRPATQAKVARAIEELDFQVDANARSLVKGGTKTVGVLIPDLTNSLLIAVTLGAESVATEAGLVQLIADTGGKLEREVKYMDTFITQRAAGMLIALNDDANFAYLYSHFKGTIPTVVLNLAVPKELAYSVVSDSEYGGWLAASHLADIGRQRLVFVGGPSGLRQVSQQAEGYQRAVAERGLSHVRTINAQSFGRADGYAVGRALASEVKAGLVDGVVCASDLQAAGIVEALRAAGVRIPDQVAIVGYDNSQVAWDSRMPLTTIAPPGDGMGRAAMELLIAEMGAPHTGPYRSLVLQPTLIARSTTTSGVRTV